MAMAGPAASPQIYRRSKLGDCLVEALDELITEDKLGPELAMKVLEQVGAGRVPRGGDAS